MRALAIIVLVLAAIDLAFDHGAVLLAIWANMQAFAATIHRGIWASP